MYSVAAAALFALAIAAVGPPELAEDRTANVDDSRPEGGQLLRSDPPAAAQAEAAGAEGSAPSLVVCREPASTSSATAGCRDGGANGYRLIRDIDWTAVGPSADDFAVPEVRLRLVGARLVGNYKF